MKKPIIDVVLEILSVLVTAPVIVFSEKSIKNTPATNSVASKIFEKITFIYS
ncbi:MAG: hypothetical protein ABIC91_02160 [Nanoarchaeota archaeon]